MSLEEFHKLGDNQTSQLKKRKKNMKFKLKNLFKDY
jgi:hypothetical protein